MMAQKVNIDTETGEILPATVPLEETLRLIRTGIGEITVSDEDIQEQMMKRMLMAQNIEELMTPPELVPAQQMLNRVILVKSVRLNKSDVDGGPGVYAVIEANDGERDLMISCGGVSVMEKLFIAQSRGWLPAELRIIQSTKRTKAGFLPLDVVLGPGTEEPF